MLVPACHMPRHMTNLDNVPNAIPIDKNYLLRIDSRLAMVIRNQLTWDELGAKIAGLYQEHYPMTHNVSDTSQTTEIPTAPHWHLAKHLVHDVFGSRDPQYDPIRQRLGNLEKSSTPALLFTLSLWLAGKMKLSVSATRPLAAVMLYAVATSPENWNILQNRNSH